MHNIIVGKLWIEQHGTMEVVNHSTGECGHERQYAWVPKGARVEVPLQGALTVLAITSRLLRLGAPSPGHRAILDFKSASWFSKDLHRVEGFIVDKE